MDITWYVRFVTVEENKEAALSLHVRHRFFPQHCTLLLSVLLSFPVFSVSQIDILAVSVSK